MNTGLEEVYTVWSQFKYLIIPAAIVVVSFIIGIALNRIIYGYIRKTDINSSGTYSQLALKALYGIPVTWSIMAGIYVSVKISPMNPHLLDILEKAMLILILLSITIIVSRVIVGIVSINLQKAEGLVKSSSLLINIVQIGSYAIGFLIILQSLGISIAPILTAMGVGGAALALALQDTLSNIIAGIHITIAKRINIGDYVRLSSGEEGTVTDINWRDTTLRGGNNQLIIVPNSKIFSAIVTNFALPDKEVSVVVHVGVSYDSDLGKVEQVSKEVALSIMKELPGGVPSFEPVVRFSSFDDSNISFSVIMRGEEFSSTALIKHEFIKKLYGRFKEEKIEISYPVRVLVNNEK